MLGVATHPAEKGNGRVRHSATGRVRLQSVMGAGAEAAPRPPDAGRSLVPSPGFLALREFRARLCRCLTARPGALFELCDAILCADHAVTSLVQLSLVPEFRRGHGALYAALADGRIDEDSSPRC